MQQAMEFIGYSVQLQILIENYKLKHPEWQYDPAWTRKLVKYQINRLMRIYAVGLKYRPRSMDTSRRWLTNLQHGDDTRMMRRWLLYMYGDDWCYSRLGITRAGL